MIAISQKSGADALTLLGDNGFANRFAALYNACPWATSFQTIEYIRTWYESYKDAYSPLILIGEHYDGTLAGCSALAVANQAAELSIIVAGGHQAEYQGWLARPKDSSRFITAALKHLADSGYLGTLHFKYLPPEIPPDWVDDARGIVPAIQLRHHRRPLIDLRVWDDRVLRKKSNKSRINRLKRLGKFEFRPLRSRAELESVIDDIAAHYDLRQGAISDTSPFMEDPNKMLFHLRLMEEKNLVRAYALFIADAPVAALIGFKNRTSVSVGIFSYSPFIAQHSPGKFILYFIASDLREEGIQYFDLTPGGNWKERFANTHDNVTEATVYFLSTEARKEAAARHLETLAKRAVRTVGIEPASLRSLVSRLKRFRLQSLPRRIKNLIRESREFRIYFMKVEHARQFEPAEEFARDRLTDLLAFHPYESWQTRQRFLSSALDRIESGCHAYSFVKDGKLLHCGWLADRQETAYFTEVGQKYKFPSKTAVLFDFFTFPEARGRGFYQKAIQTMAHDVATLGIADWISISVLADNAPSRHVIEKLGFVYRHSLFQTTVLGRVHRWAE